MDDQTRGETPGSGPGLDVPLKRDRKRLRSSEPPPERSTAPTEPPAARSSVPVEELREPELTPVEELFAGAWTASLPAQAMPASTISPEPLGSVPMHHVPTNSVPMSAAPASLDPITPRTDAPRTGAPDHDDPNTDDAEPSNEAHRARRFLSFGNSRRSRQSSEGPVDVAAAVRAPVPAQPYVPPGGFSGPGHPRLGPLAPMPPARHSGLAGLDVAALVMAVILPPIGLITAIVALVRGKQLRGWGSDLARAAISVSLVMTVVFAGVGAYVWASETEKAEQLAALKADQRAHQLVEVASEPFCGVLAAHPTIYATADPDYGWPAVDAPEGYNAAIANYAAVWAELAAVAPEGIAEETAAISARVAGVVNIANALGTSNRAGDLLGLHAQNDLATVESWYVEYCDVPEVPAPETPVE
ncbi:DUF4190 domain-containing protein [Homoserinimonas sp. A520]